MLDRTNLLNGVFVANFRMCGVNATGTTVRNYKWSTIWQAAYVMLPLSPTDGQG